MVKRAETTLFKISNLVQESFANGLRRNTISTPTLFRVTVYSAHKPKRQLKTLASGEKSLRPLYLDEDIASHTAAMCSKIRV